MCISPLSRLSRYSAASSKAAMLIVDIGECDCPPNKQHHCVQMLHLEQRRTDDCTDPRPANNTRLFIDVKNARPAGMPVRMGPRAAATEAPGDARSEIGTPIATRSSAHGHVKLMPAIIKTMHGVRCGRTRPPATQTRTTRTTPRYTQGTHFDKDRGHVSLTLSLVTPPAHMDLYATNV